MAQAPTWAFLGNFRAPTAVPVTWDPVLRWVEASLRALPGLRAELSHLRRDWARLLDPLPEVSSIDWSRFRPLRLTREEAWSDWLAHLLESSDSGAFALALFGASLGPAGSAPMRLEVAREVEVDGGERRADLLACGPGGWWIHVEVKVGDQDFEKTFEVAERLRAAYGQGQPWADFILLPAADLETWEAQAASRRRGPRVEVLTWHEVAIALRRSLRVPGESHSWRAWAHSFCGAVEQRLLGCAHADAELERESTLERLSALATQIQLMRESLE